MRIIGKFRWEYLLPTPECRITYCAQQAQMAFELATRAHAQVPSHRSPSVECFRIHVKSMVSSPGWLDDLPEVGCCRGPWRGRRTKGLLDTSTAGENNSLRHGAACQRLCKSRNRATTQPSL